MLHGPAGQGLVEPVVEPVVEDDVDQAGAEAVWLVAEL